MNTRQPNKPQLPPHTLIPNPQPLRNAFALVEVLIAIFILAIGMVSIATIFPVAIHQSRQATDDVVGQMVGEQALALLKAKGLTGVEFENGHFVSEPTVITPDGLIEGYMTQAGTITFGIGKYDTVQAFQGNGIVTGNFNFGIPNASGEPFKFIWAYEMVWPSVSYDLTQSPPISKATAIETERHPQYAWKMLLYKPDLSSPLTATILVYRVSNWDAFWTGNWPLVFPELERSRLTQLEAKIESNELELVPGDLFIKARPGGDRGGEVYAQGMGMPWRITRSRVADSDSGAARFTSMLSDGAIYDARLTRGNPGLVYFPTGDTALGRFRPVAVVTGPID